MKENEKRPFGENLREARGTAGLSQKGLAEKARVSVQMISEWERGKKGISAESLALVSNALNVSMDYLWNGQELESHDPSSSKRKIVLAIATLLQSSILKRDEYPSAPNEYEIGEEFGNLIRDIESAIRNSRRNPATLKEQLKAIAEITPYL